MYLFFRQWASSVLEIVYYFFVVLLWNESINCFVVGQFCFGTNVFHSGTHLTKNRLTRRDLAAKNATDNSDSVRKNNCAS